MRVSAVFALWFCSAIPVLLRKMWISLARAFDFLVEESSAASGHTLVQQVARFAAVGFESEQLNVVHRGGSHLRFV